MANALTNYVEKYILNSAAPLRIDDDDGNEDTLAVVSSRISGKEGATTNIVNRASKLRISNAQLLSDRDPRYKGKKVSRKSLKPENEVSYDPDLAKYIFENEKTGSKSKEGIYSDDDASTNKNQASAFLEEDYLKLGQDFEEEGATDESDTTDEEEVVQQENDIRNSDEENDTEDSEDDNSNSENDDSNIDETVNTSNLVTNVKGKSKIDNKKNIMTFSKEDSELIDKSKAVKNQYAIFDSLFETRIAMQKILSISNQLPQHDTYKHFLNKNDPAFKENLRKARNASKKLVEDLLTLQKLMLQQNEETNKIVSEIDRKQENDEEIESDEDEPSTTDLPQKKRKVEEFEEILSKRQKLLIPYRDSVLNHWQSKTNLLKNKNSSKFANFEISAVQQIKNILVNKTQLLQRTQLRSVTRGNVLHIMGKQDENLEESSTDIYDPEIFDDSDFYSRMLEDVLKSKMSLSDNMTEVSRKWIEIQNLRKKAKKKVDTKATKGRKLRYEVMSKLQQYLAPCKPPSMDDGSINMLFASLFGKSLQSEGSRSKI